MSINPALFSSDKAEWETPPELFAVLDAEFRFELDVCATKANAKCKQYITPEIDALAVRVPWVDSPLTVGRTTRCWMNPPYGRSVGRWVQKARHEALTKGGLVVCLLPARTDTAWWHSYVWDRKAHRPQAGTQVRLLKGRVRFVGAPASAPFPSVVVVFDGRDR